MGAMAREAPPAEVAQYFLLNVVSGFLCSATHNALYFMLGLNTWAFHLMHYAFLFALLSASKALGLIPWRPGSWREAAPLALTQLGVTVATAVVHSGGKDGALYTLRLVDVATTVLVFWGGQRLGIWAGGLGEGGSRGGRPWLLLTVALSSSLAWLEWERLEVGGWALAATPLLAVAEAAHLALYVQRQDRLGWHTDQLMFYTSGATSVLLAVPALLFTSDAFNADQIGTATAWEAVDFLLLFMALVFMCGLSYSKYWLLANAAPETFLVLRHTKFTAAAFGTWFLQNGYRLGFLSATGKIVAVISIAMYFYRRVQLHRAGPKAMLSAS